MRLDALQERIDADVRTGHAADLLAELEGLVAAYPYRESFVTLLMRALHAAGDRGRALGVYESARSRLADELGVAPSADLAAEHVRILRSDEGRVADSRDRHAPTSASDASVADVVPLHLTNLRAEISTFVGRERDIAALDHLADDHRLVTLTGPGGAGKTRLAAHAARRRVDDVPGGVWLVELAPVTDPADIAQTVLAVLGIRDRALVRASSAAARDNLVDPVARLVSALADKSALLVLDNCEHLIAAAADLAATILGRLSGHAHHRHEPRAPRCDRRGAVAGRAARAATGRSRAAGQCFARLRVRTASGPTRGPRCGPASRSPTTTPT